MEDRESPGNRASGAGFAWSREDFEALGGPGASAPPAKRSGRRRLADAVSKAFGRAGLELRRRRQPDDLRGRIDHPAAATLLAHGRDFIMDVPVERLRLTHFFRATRRGGHPMVELAHRVAAGAGRDHALDPVATFYERWQPRHRGEFLGVAAPGSALAALPAWVPVSPWTGTDAPMLSRRMAHFNRWENVLFGPPLGIRDGHVTAGGP